MAESSFDIVSKIDHMEVDNAFNQCDRELATRFDFKNTGTKIEKTAEKIMIESDTEERAKAAEERAKAAEERFRIIETAFEAAERCFAL